MGSSRSGGRSRAPLAIRNRGTAGRARAFQNRPDSQGAETGPERQPALAWISRTPKIAELFTRSTVRFRGGGG